MYEVSRRFYADFVPKLEALADRHAGDADQAKAAAARALRARLDEVLESEDHRWYIGRMPPEEAARRKRAAEEFKARYDPAR